MSLEATNHVWKHTFYSAAQSYILLAIADVVNDTYGNRFFMSVPSLALKTKCSERTVQRALSQFVEDGWLTVEVEGSGRGKTTEYQFQLLKGDNLTPINEEKVTDLPLKGDKSGTQRVTNEVSIHLLELNRTQEEPQEFTPEMEVCQYLADAIGKRGLKPRPADTVIFSRRWLSEARLLLEGKIGRGDTLEASGALTVNQIKAAIDYAMNDPFWPPNILSIAKLRIQYPTLRMQATAAKQKQPKGALPASSNPVTPPPPHKEFDFGDYIGCYACGTKWPCELERARLGA